VAVSLCVQERVRSTVGDEPMWPYFNSGLVMVPRGLAFKLQTTWIQLALELRDRNLLGTDTHPWCVVVPRPSPHWPIMRCGA
jgi:hypothetical protein